jgi:hypothetical protein
LLVPQQAEASQPQVMVLNTTPLLLVPQHLLFHLELGGWSTLLLVAAVAEAAESLKILLVAAAAEAAVAEC